MERNPSSALDGRLIDNEFSEIDTYQVRCYSRPMKKLCGCLLVIMVSGLLLAGCKAPQTVPAASPTSVAESHGGHHHTAPHGGALVVLGEEVAHIEFVVEPDSGVLTAYVLDGEAEKAVRIPSGTIEIELKPNGKLSLEAVADELTGETKNDTSTFRAESDLLKGKDSFEAAIVSVKVKGQTFEDVAFRYPDGNELHEHQGHGHDHDHDHDHGHDHDEHPGHDSL